MKRHIEWEKTLLCAYAFTRITVGFISAVIFCERSLDNFNEGTCIMEIIFGLNCC